MVLQWRVSRPAAALEGAGSAGMAGSAATLSIPGARTLHVRNIGRDGTGRFESEDALREIFSEYGGFVQATVRHRIAEDGTNTSWALVFMKDKAGADKALNARVMAGDTVLMVSRFNQDTAAKSTGAMQRVIKRSNRLYTLRMSGGEIPFCVRHGVFHWCRDFQRDGERGAHQESLVVDVGELLSEVPLFSGLSPAELRELFNSGVELVKEQGGFICRQGDAGEHFFLLTEGTAIAQVDVQGSAAEGTAEAVTVKYYSKGSYFGELALMQADSKRAASIKVTSPEARCIMISRERFKPLQDKMHRRNGPELLPTTAAALAPSLPPRDYNTSSLLPPESEALIPPGRGVSLLQAHSVIMGGSSSADPSTTTGDSAQSTGSCSDSGSGASPVHDGRKLPSPDQQMVTPERKNGSHGSPVSPNQSPALVPLHRLGMAHSGIAVSGQASRGKSMQHYKRSKSSLDFFVDPDKMTFGQMAFPEGTRDLQVPNTDSILEAGQAKFLRMYSAQAATPFDKLSHNSQETRTRLLRGLTDFMRYEWGLLSPSMIISVTGNALPFTLRPRYEALFSSALLNATRNTNAWIITGGSDAGVMKLVGDALKTSKRSTPCLAIASWGVVWGRTALTHTAEEVQEQSHHVHEAPSTPAHKARAPRSRRLVLEADSSSTKQSGTVLGASAGISSGRSNSKSSGTAIPSGRTLHVRNIGKDSNGKYDSENALRKVFSEYGEFVQATVRHRISEDGTNTSWALVTMVDKAAADRAINATVMAGDTVLTVRRFDTDIAKTSTGAMKHQSFQNALAGKALRGSVKHPFVYTGEWHEGEGDYPPHFSQGTKINHNHSHYLFVDNNTQNVFGTEVSLMVASLCLARLLVCTLWLNPCLLLVIWVITGSLSLRAGGFHQLPPRVE